MKDDLQKSDSCGLKSERKKILTSSTCSLACLSTNLGAFCPMVVHLPSEKSILPYFSGPRGVAILDCDSHSQAGSTTSPPQYPRSAEAECRRPQVRWGGLGLTTEKSAADLTSELTQFRLSDNTRNLNVILQYQMSEYQISSFLIHAFARARTFFMKIAIFTAILTHNMAKVKRILR